MLNEIWKTVLETKSGYTSSAKEIRINFLGIFVTEIT